MSNGYTYEFRPRIKLKQKPYTYKRIYYITTHILNQPKKKNFKNKDYYMFFTTLITNIYDCFTKNMCSRILENVFQWAINHHRVLQVKIQKEMCTTIPSFRLQKFVTTF